MIIYQIRTAANVQGRVTGRHATGLALWESELCLDEGSARDVLHEIAFRLWEAEIWRGEGDPKFEMTWTLGADDPAYADFPKNIFRPHLSGFIKDVPPEKFTGLIYRSTPHVTTRMTLDCDNYTPWFVNPSAARLALYDVAKVRWQHSLVGDGLILVHDEDRETARRLDREEEAS